MSENFSDPTLGVAGRELQAQGGPQAQVQPTWLDEHLSIDPQQPLREYTSPNPRNVSSVPPPQSPSGPVYPSQHPSQPTWPGYYAGQSVSTWPPAPAYPGGFAAVGNGQPAPTYPGGYAPYPGYSPNAGYPGYPAYGMPIYPYTNGYYSWLQVPAAPKRDAYLFGVGIAAFVCACLTVLGGLACMALFLFSSLAPSPNMTDSTRFAGLLLLLTLGDVGNAGGSICIYHSVRSAFMRKPSSTIWLPRFWLFLLCYIVTLGLGYWLQTLNADVTMPALTGLLIFLDAVFPALAILALGVRRLRFPRFGAWPTSWRRLTLALVSGATLAVILASILELIFEIVLFGVQGNNALQSLMNSNTNSVDPSIALILLIMLAVVAPIVEELVKPLAVVLLIGRVQSKAEAFALGLACGIGFNLVETIGYISSGYNDWLNVALLRSGSGLLHGFGAGMMALGWYYLTHKEEGSWQRRTLLAVGCGVYAIFQHALWNGLAFLVLIPGPIGDFAQNWRWNLGPVIIDAPTLFMLIELIGILVFFVILTGKLRSKAHQPPTKSLSGEPAHEHRPNELASIVPNA